MFIHLGGDISVLQREITGIFAINLAKTGIATKEYLALAKSEKKLITIGDSRDIKSFIITNNAVYLSPISSVTLQKRANSFAEVIS